MKWLAPLIFFELYLAATILLFFFGPWDWNVDAPVLLASYLVAAQVQCRLRKSMLVLSIGLTH